jgi:hypothetical protein
MIELSFLHPIKLLIMRLLFSIALASFFCFGSQLLHAQSADASKLPELKYKEISKEGKKALKEMSEGLCGCLKEHGDGWLMPSSLL